MTTAIGSTKRSKAKARKTKDAQCQIAISVPAWKTVLLRGGNDGAIGTKLPLDEWINRRVILDLDHDVVMEVHGLLNLADSRKCSGCRKHAFATSYASAALLNSRFAPPRECQECGKRLTAEKDPSMSRHGHNLSAWAKARLDCLGGTDAIRRLLAREAKAGRVGDLALIKFLGDGARGSGAKLARIQKENFPMTASARLARS